MRVDFREHHVPSGNRIDEPDFVSSPHFVANALAPAPFGERPELLERGEVDRLLDRDHSACFHRSTVAGPPTRLLASDRLSNPSSRKEPLPNDLGCILFRLFRNGAEEESPPREARPVGRSEARGEPGDVLEERFGSSSEPLALELTVAPNPPLTLGAQEREEVRLRGKGFRLDAVPKREISQTVRVFEGRSIELFRDRSREHVGILKVAQNVLQGFHSPEQSAHPLELRERFEKVAKSLRREAGAVEPGCVLDTVDRGKRLVQGFRRFRESRSGHCEEARIEIFQTSPERRERFLERSTERVEVAPQRFPVGPKAVPRGESSSKLLGARSSLGIEPGGFFREPRHLDVQIPGLVGARCQLSQSSPPLLADPPLQVGSIGALDASESPERDPEIVQGFSVVASFESGKRRLRLREQAKAEVSGRLLWRPFEQAESETHR